MEKRIRRAFCLFLLCILVLAPGGAAPPASAAAPEEASVEEAVAAGAGRRVGAYFFYWYVLPDQTEILPVDRYMAFVPPGVSAKDLTTHLFPYQIPYQGGTYNAAYYNSTDRRWWEWQFRDMAEAGLDFAVLNSWDGTTFTRPEARIENIGRYINAALDTLGRPLQVALYDDTISEVYQWNLRVRGSLPPAECMPPTAPGCEQYRMPLSDSANWQYFYDKMDAFYGAVNRVHWATLDGRRVDQGGRVLILMHQGEGYFRDIVGGGTRYAARLFCSMKKHWMERFAGPPPFLLPNGTWGLWGAGDPALQQPARCSSVGIEVPGDPYIIDGWSAYGMANGGVCTNPAYPGVCLFPYTTDACRTTAYIGPGVDLFLGSTTCAYSGPYGGEGPNYRPYYNARWWSLEGETLGYCDDGRCQDRFYFQSWSIVAAAEPPVDLVVIESWNELAEGSSIGKLVNYVAPDLMLGGGPPVPPLTFIQNPYHESPWSPWFWIFRSRDLIAQWRGEVPGIAVPVDDPDLLPGWSRDQGNLGRWFYGSGFHYALENAASAPVSWMALLPQDGYYDVYAYWPQVLGATEEAPYTVHHALGASVVHIDQSRYWDAGGWAFLGRYPFRGGGLYGRVVLSNQVQNPQGRYVLADAVRFVYRAPWVRPALPPRTFLAVVLKNRRLSAAGWDAAPPAAASPPSRPDGYPVPTIVPPPSPTPSPSPTPPPPDCTPPQSRVTHLPAFVNQVGFWVSWTSSDEGAGVARIQVQARDGAAGPWQDWLPYAGDMALYEPAVEGHTYYFRSRAVDWAGNVESWPLLPDASTTVDLSPPTSQVEALAPYQRAAFLVRWAGQDNLSGVAAYDLQYCVDSCNLTRSVWHNWLTATPQTAAEFSAVEEGHTYYFRSRARDLAGNVEDWPKVPDAFTTLDASPPNSAVAILPPYSRSPFVVTWSGQDGLSGVADYDLQFCRAHCAEPSRAMWIDWLLGVTTTQALFQGDDGTVFFRSRARDRAGNLEPYPLLPDSTTHIDTTPPSSQVDALPDYSGPAFIVSWQGQDALSGVASYDLQYCLGNCSDPALAGNASWADWLTATTATKALFGGGQDGQSYSFRSRARDRAGNLEPWPNKADAVTVVDAAAPASAVATLPVYSAPSFAVAWSGVDALSGVAAYDVQVCHEGCDSPSGPWAGWLTGTAALSSTYNGEDGRACYFRSRAYDRVGNVEKWPAAPDAWTVVDGSPPVALVDPLPAYSPAVFTVTWSGKDAGSGVASYDLQISLAWEPSPGDWTDWLTGTQATAGTFYGSAGQVVAFRARAWDAVGNGGDYPGGPQAWTQVDAAGPQTWFVPIGSGQHEDSALLLWTGQDDLSGLAAYDLYVADESTGAWQPWLQAVTMTQSTFTGQAGHTYHFCVRGIDRVGNREAKDCPPEEGGWPLGGEAVVALPPTSRVAGLPLLAPGPLFLVRWTGRPDSLVYNIQVRDLDEGTWQDWLVATTETAAWFSGVPGHRYGFRSQALSTSGQEPWPCDYDARTTVPRDGGGGAPGPQ